MITRFTMSLRSPRRLTLLSLIAFLLVLALLNLSPWGPNRSSYERLPLFYPPSQQEATGHGSQSDGESSWYDSLVNGEVAELPNPPPPSNMQDYIQEMLQWPRPTWDGHWPGFGDYIDKDYDPNRWEEFSV